jgi:hypothetical protein
MSANCAFDYAIPFDIMVGYWVGTASIYSPKGVYVMSTKSYVSVFWEEPYNTKTKKGKISFRESAEDEFAPGSAFFDSRRGKGIGKLLGKKVAITAGALRTLAFDLDVRGLHCDGGAGPVYVDGRQTRPDAYQMHVTKKEDNGDVHHIYNSHHLPSPDDWHIIGPIVGPIKEKGKVIEGAVGLAVVQYFRRISYDVPEESIYPLQ